MTWTASQSPVPAQRREQKSLSRPGVRLFLTLCLAVALVAGYAPARSLLRAVSIAYRFSDSHPLAFRLYWKLSALQVRQSIVTIPSRWGAIPARSFSSSAREDAPVLIVVHGFVRKGMNDPPTSTIAEELATDGFHVLVPNIASEQKMLIEPEAVHQIGEVAHWARQTSGRRVMLMGVSFGGGLALRAASLPEYADDIRVTFCVGAFNDIERLSAFYTGLGVSGPDGVADRTPPARVGGPVMAMQHLDEMVPPDDVAPMRDLLSSLLMVEAGMPVVQQKLGSMPPRLQDEFRTLMTTDGAQGRRYRMMWERHRAVYDAMSPHGHLGALSSEVFLLHGSNDPLISKVEAQWNASELKAAGKKVHLVLSPYLVHWDMQKGTSMRGKLELAVFLARVLRAAHG